MAKFNAESESVRILFTSDNVWPLYWLKIQNGGYGLIILFINSLFL